MEAVFLLSILHYLSFTSMLVDTCLLMVKEHSSSVEILYYGMSAEAPRELVAENDCTSGKRAETSWCERILRDYRNCLRLPEGTLGSQISDLRYDLVEDGWKPITTRHIFLCCVLMRSRDPQYIPTDQAG
ncbi:uncharacterized protein EDB91DRAFT_47212 [Suillus paluster]|uniref:uncharacterized protein n=1 Tax=Suillus paluster TaxID=48578 RepID=UPI001B869FEB|nr:uncharacterized protein EDB91DRAFT_47212 [Suillus paluster]KAG1747852.1 hypothetical protein EDB91DRAFT_47212 [Suillus paluster]